MAQTAPGTVISNRANVSYLEDGITPLTVQTNQVDIITIGSPTPAIMTFNRIASTGSGIPLGPTACAQGGGPFVPLPDPVLIGGTTIDPNLPYNLTPAGQYQAGEPVFITLEDLDQNLDPGARDTVEVTISGSPGGDTETLQLSETANDSGLFAGYLQTAPGAIAPGDCALQISTGSDIDGFYQDPDDSTDTAQAQAIVDADPSLLFLQKNAGVNVASIGDFVQYTLLLENTSGVAQSATTIVDVLPVGLRLVPGSVYVDDVPSSDPAIGSDGRSLSFDVGDLDPGDTISIRYVTEVTVGATGETAINTAIANSIFSGASSNEARATLQLVEDLFTSKAIVVGRTILDSCDAEVSNDFNGVAGLRVYMEDGRYAITDEGGRFHFEGLEPGTHVVQLDTATVPDTLEVIDCQTDTRSAGRNFSRFVDLRAGSLWRADFYLRERAPPGGEVAIELSGERASTETILYTVNLQGDGLPLDDTILNVVLPQGLTYMPGTARVRGRRGNEPETRASVVSFRLGDKAATWDEQITLRARLADDEGGELLAKAVATYLMPNGETGRTPMVESAFDFTPELRERRSISFVPKFTTLDATLTRGDKDRLDEIISGWQGGSDMRLIATGHTDSHTISPGHPEFADNYALSEARANAVAQYVAQQLNIPGEQLEVRGVGSDLPVADNSTKEGRARNRRVDLQLESQAIVREAELSDESRSSGLAVAKTVGTHDEATDDFIVSEAVELADQPVFSDPTFIETQDAGTGWLAPVDNYSPPIPAMKIAIKHEPGYVVELSVNGKAVDPLNFTGTEVSRRKTVAISRWRGVDLRDGENLLSAIVRNKDRSDFEKIETTVNYSGGPVRGVFNREASRPIADGTTSPIIAMQLFDRFGMPARPTTTGGFTVDSPYQSQADVDALTEQQLVAVGNRESIYRVGEDGMAYLELAPTAQTGEATIRLQFSNNRQQEVRVWLEPAPRDWILVGFAEGTLGYNTLKDNMDDAEDAGFEDDTYTDGHVSFFAKGQIKGDYLLTLAYQDDVDDDEADQTLFGTVDPNQYYTLYGDTTAQSFEASSRRGLFLKIERREFYALFGDFETGLTVTELGRYSRSLSGFRSEYRGQQFAYNAFASDTDKAFIRDEIPGDGTSGPYYLSGTPVVINSDKLEVQTRDRFRSEVIVETRPLAPYIDYTIDYQTGQVILKQPVSSRDSSFNPNYIVATFETVEQTGENISAGGRGSWTSEDGRAEAGVTYIHQGTEGDSGDLVAADVSYQIDENTEVRAEIATSDTDLAGSNYGLLAELDHQGERTETRVWFQELESGFGLGQQNISETGTRKYGFDGRYRLTEELSLVGSAFRQDNLVNDAQQDVVEAEVQYQNDNRSAAIGVIGARDDFDGGDSFESNQVFATGSVGLFENLVTMRTSAETSLNGDSASANYPDRLLLGLDYRMTDTTLLFSEMEYANGDDWDSVMTRVGVQSQPWQGAQVNSAVNREQTEFGPRTFATLGLTQGWQMNDKWYFDFGLDQSRTVDDEPARVNPEAPPASGNVDGADFIATFAGAMYRSEFWTATSRVEYRDSDIDTRMNLLGGFYREEIQGRGFSANLQLLTSDFDIGGSSTLADLRLGWSWRPPESEWIVFERLDVIYERNDGEFSDMKAWKLVNNLNANWMLNLDTQMEFQFGAKYARSNVGGDSYTGFTNVLGTGIRHDLGERWDVGVHGDVMHSSNADVVTYGWGVDVGVTIMDNVWISLGYNFAGFDDDDFSGSNYTAQGPFITFRIKADEKTFHDLIDREETP